MVKVIDFGLAKLTGWGVKTTHQRLMGTAFYMAPEHLRSKPPGHRMDVYAMGLVLYEAIAGAHPIMQLGGPLTMLVVCGRQLNYTPPPLATLVREVPGDLSDLVQRAIEKDPARRIATMSELAAGLQSVLSRLLVDRRNVVRDLPLPGREVGLQRTIPMKAHEEPPVPRGAGGTVKLQAFDAPPVSVPPSSTLPAGPRLRGRDAPGDRGAPDGRPPRDGAAGEGRPSPPSSDGRSDRARPRDRRWGGLVRHPGAPHGARRPPGATASVGHSDGERGAWRCGSARCRGRRGRERSAGKTARLETGSGGRSCGPPEAIASENLPSRQLFLMVRGASGAATT